jgi:hypothetical protein
MRPVLDRLRRAYQAAALLLLTTALLCLAVNVACWLVLAFLPGPNLPVVKKYGVDALARAYPDLSRDEVAQLLSESWSRPAAFEPYLHFRETPHTGRFVNVHLEGFRHSTDQGPWPPDPARFNVFVFGGSTTFGYGVADHQTVPSQLGPLLAEALRTKVSIYNFGQCFYQSTQERLLFEKLLLAGHIPHMAVFIDGLNDCYYPDGAPQADPRLTQMMAGRAATPEAPRLFSPLAVGRLAERLSPAGRAAAAEPVDPAAWPKELGDPRIVIDRLCLRYLKNKSLIERIAGTYPVEVWFIWQPVPTYKYDLAHHPFAEGIGAHWRSKEGYERMAEVVQRFPPGDNFLWCADLQEGVAEPLYIDAIHYSPAMSGRLAREIVRQMKERRTGRAAVEARP